MKNGTIKTFSKAVRSILAMTTSTLLLSLTYLLIPALSSAQKSNLNREILELIETYDRVEGSGYGWPAKKGFHGTTRNLYLRKHRVARGNGETHCVGITFEAMWRTLSGHTRIKNSLTHKEAKSLRRIWFVPVDGGKGPADALPKFDLGFEIKDKNKAIPGDFIQLWNKDHSSGHSAVFLGWNRNDEGEISGVSYWSSQPWTQGIGYSEFAFGTGPNDMDFDSTHIARLAF